MTSDQDGDAKRTVELSHAEIELLRKACQAYRKTIPVYLRAGAVELEALKSVLNKLS